MAHSESLAARHAEISERFTTLVRGAVQWDVPSPVPEWNAADVVDHLTTWFPEFIAPSGIALPEPTTDRLTSWVIQVQAVQAILDDPTASAGAFIHPMLPPGQSVGQAINSFYTTDVFMHAWDLARATGQDDRLDADTCAEILAGMESMADMIRGSGQFGVQQPVAPDADAQDRLIAFIGRDPSWRPPTS